MKTISIPNCAGLLAGLLLLLSPTPQAVGRIIINNADGPGEGFNDPAPFTPVGGNPATTVGQARLIAFQYAADIWTAALESSVDIVVDARFDPLPCTATLAVLGAAGPITAAANFPNVAPYPAATANTWYPIALANAIAGTDLDPTTAEIQATFNSDLGTPGCFAGTGWYYGLDASPSGTDLDLVTVLLHEFGHGLGFLTLVDMTTGTRPSNRNDTYMLHLENHGATPSAWSAMNNAQRLAAVTSDPNAHWTGANVLAEAPLIPLTAGVASGHVRVYGPSPLELGSSISHFSTALTPNDLMEPSYVAPNHDLCLALQLMKDIGWRVHEEGDLYVKDRPWDGGVEPNPDTGAMWKSTDIWVRNSPGSGLTSHQNPEYSPITPAYVNVRVRNRGCRPASGEVKLYWAKASTGLNWPTHWVGYATSIPGCAATLFGDQIPTASPLLITSLAPGAEAVFEVPWNVPNPADYACFTSDPAHFCLLARIETSSTSPFGMTFTEGSNISNNTRNNNNIAWKNVTVVDNLPGLTFGERTAMVIMRNPGKHRAKLSLRFGSEHPIPFDQFARITLQLDGKLVERWWEAGGASRNMEPLGNGAFQLFGKGASLDNLVLEPDEMHVLRFGFSLYNREDTNRPPAYEFDVAQYDTTDGEPVLVGGETFTLDLNKVALVQARGRWKYLDDGSDLDKPWRHPAYDDSNWSIGQAQFGYGDGDETTVVAARTKQGPIITTYFRKRFEVDHLGLIRNLTARILCDDGCIGYLNGKELFRYNMPVQTVSFATPARNAAPDDGLYWHAIQVDPSALVEGENLLAIEVHQATDNDRDMSFDLALLANCPPTPPTVRLVTPNDGAVMSDGPITLLAEAIDPDGSIRHVEFYQGDAKWAEVTTPPYRLALENLEPRDYCFTARATDNFGNSSVSAPISVLIQRGCSPLFIIRKGDELRLIWTGNCVLQHTTELDPPVWKDVPGTPSSPYVTTAAPLPHKYYRLRPR